MAVVMQPAFLIEVLTLKTQWVVDCSDVEPGDFAVGAVAGGPDDFALGVGEFLGCAEVVELVVVGLRFFWTEAFQQDERAKAVRFVEVAAMLFGVVFGNQFVALPEKLRRYAVYGFADASPKRVIAKTKNGN
jgi:hypothetical protein